MSSIVKRHQYGDYLNVGTDEEEDYVLMGFGFTQIDEEPGAQTETSKYVNDVTSSTEIVSYESSFPFECDQASDEKGVDALYTVGRNHYVGEDAEFDYVRVDVWNPVEDQEGVYEARKFRVAAEISTIEGENKQVISGTLHAIGDPVIGTFNTKTKTFTAAAE